jgi:hypothetical protein
VIKCGVCLLSAEDDNSWFLHATFLRSASCFCDCG